MSTRFNLELVPHENRMAGICLAATVRDGIYPYKARDIVIYSDYDIDLARDRFEVIIYGQGNWMFGTFVPIERKDVFDSNGYDLGSSLGREVLKEFWTRYRPPLSDNIILGDT